MRKSTAKYKHKYYNRNFFENNEYRDSCENGDEEPNNYWNDDEDYDNYVNDNEYCDNNANDDEYCDNYENDDEGIIYTSRPINAEGGPAETIKEIYVASFDHSTLS